MALFRDMVCYQEEVRDPRASPSAQPVIEKARGSAPAQINVPRDFWTQVIDIDCRRSCAWSGRRAGPRPSPGGETAVGRQIPVILRRRRDPGGRHPDCQVALAERLDAPVCSGYQHNDSFRARIRWLRALWAITARRRRWS